MQQISTLIQTVAHQNVETDQLTQKQKWLESITDTQRILDRVANPYVKMLIKLENENIIGTGYINLEEPIAHVGGLYIHPEFQRQNIGYHLLEHLLAYTEKEQKAQAQIAKTNLPSKKLFTKYGFQYLKESPSKFFNPSIWEHWTRN